jgi:hypothetical protein
MPFDEDGVGDYDVGVIFFLNGEDHLQMATFSWPLTRVRLEGGQLLSNIVTWWSENPILRSRRNGK